MKKIYEDYKDIIRLILILTVVLLSVSVIHFFLRKKIRIDIIDENNIIMENLIKEGKTNDIDYNIILKDLNNTINTIEKCKEDNNGDNTYTTIFYEKACDIMDSKMKLIGKVISERLDDESKNQLNYTLDKFYADLDTDEESIYRVYSSSIDAKLNIYESRYNKLKEKCKTLAYDYIAVLDNKD